MIMYKLIKVLTSLWLLLAVSVSYADSTRSFKQVIASGELRIGVSLADPWVMKKSSAELMGSEIDMAKRLSADMNLKPVLKEYSWDGLIPALQNGEIDIIISGLVISPDKALKVNFSRPYASSGISLMANTDLTKSFKTAQELNNPTVAIGVVANSTQADVTKRVFSKSAIKTFPSTQQLNEALLAGKLHAAVALDPSPRFMQLLYPEQIDLPLGAPIIAGREGLAIHQGDVDFLAFINAWIEARQADGWLDTTRTYWFDSIKWQER
jgi:polar amino acid transport system substrate-binding protein